VAYDTPGTAAPATPVVSQLSNKRDNKAALAWANEHFKKCRDARSKAERQWYLNLAFYFGRQNVVITSTAAATNGFVLRTPDAPPWRVRLVINRIQPIIRTLLAKLTSNKPIFTVTPLSAEDRDIVAARIGEQIFNAAWSTKNIQKVVRQAVWWTSLTGVGFIKCYWDPDAVDKDSDQMGDICYERVDPYHILCPNLEEEDIENQPYVLHVMTKSLEWAKANYKKDFPVVKSTDNVLDDQFLSVLDVEKSQREEVLCLEYWIKPGYSEEYKDGGYILVVGDTVIENQKSFPYDHGMYPFAKIDDIPSGKFYADSVVTSLIPIQREYNRTRSQIVEAKNRMAKPQLLAAQGSIDPRRITSEPGQVIEYIPGFPAPSPLPLQGLPSYVENSLERLLADMDDISGQHEISRGNTPPQVTAATAISFLQEQDDSKLAYTVASIEDAIEKLGRLTLAYVRQFWTTPRLVRVVGNDGAFEAAFYKAKDLGNAYDVRVEAGSTLQMSKAAKQAFIMDAMKNGLLPPDMGMEMLGIAGIDRIFQNLMVDRRQAERENLKMSLGIQVMANDYDNHGLHLEVHNRFRKTQEYELLDPNNQQLFEVHCAQHQMYQFNAIQESQTSGLEMPGLPPGAQGNVPPEGPPMPPGPQQ
jgi:hypothetical protein